MSLLLLLGGGGGGGGGAITYDTTTSTTGTSVSSLTWSHTIADQANRIILVFASSEDDTDSTDVVITGVTYNGEALTAIRYEDINIPAVSRNRIYAWYRVAPTVGAHDVVVTYQGTVAGAIGVAISYYGVDQSSPINANNGTADAVGAGSTGEVTVTTTVDNCMVVDGLQGYASGTTLTVDGSQTERANITLAGFCRQGDSQELKAALGACAMTWAFGANQCYVQVGVALTPAAAAGPTGVKTINDLAIASVKTINDLVIASVKTIMG